MAFLIMVFVFLIIAAGMARVFAWLNVGPFVKKSLSFHPKPNNPCPKLAAINLVFLNEGYSGTVRVADADLLWVDNPILTEMIQEADIECDLIWSIPTYQWRLRVIPDTAPGWVKEQYSHTLMTPTHAVGFNRAQVT